MDIASLYEALKACIFRIDPAEAGLDQIFLSLENPSRQIADLLNVARADCELLIEPNVFCPGGGEKKKSRVFSGEAAADSDAILIEYPCLDGCSVSIRLWPRAGTVWSQAELEALYLTADLAYLIYSRSDMMGKVARAPKIDMLTGLSSSRDLPVLQKRIFAKQRAEDYSALYINLRGFKLLNQSLGSQAGDELILLFTRVLSGYLSAEDEILVRLGGDNFFVMVFKDRLQDFIRLIQDVDLPCQLDGKTQQIHLSAWSGIYHLQPGDSVFTALMNASIAYDVARRSNRPYAIFRPEDLKRSMHSKSVAHSFPEAMKMREIVPFYQPKVDVRSGRLIGAEALIRWVREGELISPARFVPDLENTGLISAADRYMLDAVCRDLRAWLNAGLDPVPVSVNYSPKDFYEEDLVEYTITTLEKYQVPGRYLEIEITESSFYENSMVLLSFIREMHAHGVRMALDDFGTGYSSINMFRSLSFDTVKLDRSFFSDLDRKDEKDKIILKSMAGMLQDLDLFTVSEGVETRAQLAFAREIGCNVIQGFYFDRPLSAPDFTKRMKMGFYGLD